MIYCLNTSTIKPQALLDKIRLVGEAGYDGIELWLNSVWEFVAREARSRTCKKQSPTKE